MGTVTMVEQATEPRRKHCRRSSQAEASRAGPGHLGA
jgi:hypothetical protein